MRWKWTGASLLAAGAALPVLASGEGGGADKLIQPEVGTIFWTAVTFGITLLILGKFAWKPLLGALDARAKSIQDDLDQAANNRREAEALMGQHREMLNAAHRERAEAVAQGQQDAERAKAEIMEEARRQREQLIQQAQTQIQSSLTQARTELRTVTADLAIQAAEKLMARNLDDATQRKLVEDYLADLERTGGDSTVQPS